jgi:hypothetical protein
VNGRRNPELLSDIMYSLDLGRRRSGPFKEIDWRREVEKT